MKLIQFLVLSLVLGMSAQLSYAGKKSAPSCGEVSSSKSKDLPSSESAAAKDDAKKKSAAHSAE